MRLDGWDTRMHAAIDRHSALPYQAGLSDCYTMAMECVEAITGVRPYADVGYSTDAAGAKAMVRKGFRSLGEAVAALFPERPKMSAMRGDIAVIDGTSGDTLAVVVNGGLAWKNETVHILPISAAKIIYAVD